MSLICLGELVIDFLPGNEEGIYIRKAGGAPANVAVAAARNGLDVGFCGRVGNDDRDACIAAVQQVLPDVDFLKISEEEEDMLGVAPAEAAQKYNIAVLVETLGSAGARCHWNGKILEAPGRKAKCVDATGAGDAFWGGFLSCLLLEGVRTVDDLNEELLRKALNYGNIASWLCVQKKGAMESLPTNDEIVAILEAEK